MINLDEALKEAVRINHKFRFIAVDKRGTIHAYFFKPPCRKDKGTWGDNGFKFFLGWYGGGVKWKKTLRKIT